MRIDLVWHTEIEDLNLGEAYTDVLPPVGALIAHAAQCFLPSPKPVSWRVVAVQIVPAAPGSMSARHPGAEQYGVYHVFVEPAEGSFHP